MGGQDLGPVNYFTDFPSVPVTFLEAPKYGISLFDLAFISEVMRRLHAHLFRRFIIYAQIGRLFGRRCVIIPDFTNDQEAHEKLTASLVIRELLIETTVRHRFTPLGRL